MLILDATRITTFTTLRIKTTKTYKMSKNNSPIYAKMSAVNVGSTNNPLSADEMVPGRLM